MHTLKRLTISLIYLVGMLIITACNAEKGSHQMDDAYYRIAGELIVDAVPDAEMFGMQMFADSADKHFHQSGATRHGAASKSGFPLPRIPEHVRVIWRKATKAARDEDGQLTFVGPLAADYTIPVASRIPEAVLEEVRKNGGALRIKFRLKPDGVMLGWDIQRTHKSGHGFVYSDAGGDFLDTLY